MEDHYKFIFIPITSLTDFRRIYKQKILCSSTKCQCCPLLRSKDKLKCTQQARHIPTNIASVVKVPTSCMPQPAKPARTR